jgi:hypothetical protein
MSPDKTLMPKFLLLATLFSIALSASAQRVLVHVYIVDKPAKKNNDTIFYDYNRKLTWNDFQGKVDNNNIGAALTASGYAFDANIIGDPKTIYLNISVYTYFIKSGSWRKPEVNTDYYLLHEQRHFDITRLGAETFADRLSKAKFTKDNYNKVIDSVFDKVYNENIALQNRYDNETRHSLNHDIQLKWNELIAEDLKKIYSQSVSAGSQ